VKEKERKREHFRKQTRSRAGFAPEALGVSPEDGVLSVSRGRLGLGRELREFGAVAIMAI
jgi:hypothetical protein